MTFERLIEIAEAVCKEIREDPDHPARKDTCVNWADFHCRGAEWYRDSWGNEGYRVYIEEAAPNAMNHKNLAPYISDKIEQVWPECETVDVVLEW